MGISIYFGDRAEALAGGFGFTEAGAWRGGTLPEEAETSRICHSERSEESASPVPCCLLPVASGGRYPSTGLEAGPPAFGCQLRQHSRRNGNEIHNSPPDCCALQAGEVLAAPADGRAAGLVLDDRFLPERRGAEAARRALAGWTGLVICDFERPPSPLLAELVRSLAGSRTVLPPAWAELPHAAVLVGLWMGEYPFPRWLEEQRARYGEVVLDGLPLRTAAAPGDAREPWTGPLPGPGFPCPGLGCLHRRLPDGRIVFWDTRETLAARIRSADVPVIVFSEDWERLE